MLQEHLGYLSDSLRSELFRKAIGAVVKPGDRVADLGCGSGILGLLCLKAGAGHVYAVDETAMIHVARETFARAGLAGRVNFLQGRCQQVELPERVDVVVCDHVGHFGFDYGIVELFRDAKRRFLKPGGAMIPARIELQLAAVESARHRKLAEGWGTAVVPTEFHWLREQALNTKVHVNFQREEILSPPAAAGSIDFLGDARGFYSSTAELRATRDGTVHGLGGWFDCELSAGVRMTNSPLAEKKIDRAQAFLPIGEAVQVKAGDEVKATLMLRPSDNLLAWTVEFPASGRRYSHSNWQGMLLSPEELHRANPSRVPKPGRAGLARRTVLGYCDGRRTAREIEQAVLKEHPGLFPSAEEAANFVALVLARDTE